MVQTSPAAVESPPVAPRGVPGRVNWWTPGDPVAGRGRRLLVGVARWSGYDVRVLDRTAAVLARGPADVVVDVFDMDAVHTPAGFDRYIPGLGDVLVSPIAGLWEGGRLVRSAVGHPARELVAEVLGVTVDTLLPAPASHAFAG